MISDVSIHEIINSIFVFIGITCAIALPVIRYNCRKKAGIDPFFQWELLRHDVPNGYMLPQFFIILLSPLSGGYLVSDKKALIMCGIYAIVLAISDVLDSGRSPCLRTRASDRKDDGGSKS